MGAAEHYCKSHAHHSGRKHDDLTIRLGGSDPNKSFKCQLLLGNAKSVVHLARFMRILQVIVES